MNFNINPNLKMVLGWVFKHNLNGFLAIFKSIYANKKLTGEFLPMKVFICPSMNAVIDIHKKANININGRLIVKPWMGRGGTLFIKASKGSTFNLLSDLYCGPNIHLYINEYATLDIAGSDERISTITADSKVLVHKNIKIGLGTIIAWDCCITDSDWHHLNGKLGVKNIVIGEHVWIASRVSVLKGVVIPNGSIIASNSVVNKSINSEHCLSAGVPATIIKNSMEWHY